MGIGHDLRNDGLRLIVHPCYVQRLPDVQRTQVSLLIPAVPIVKTIGHVAGLLDLIQQNALADGVHGTRRDIKHVAGLHGHKPQQLFDLLAMLGGFGQRFLGGAFLDAIYQLGVRRGLQDGPGSVLPSLFSTRRA